jgi:hypothetical protein
MFRTATLFLLPIILWAEIDSLDTGKVRFRDYALEICSRCAARNLSCGCHLGQLNPPLLLLQEYPEKYEESRQKVLNYEFSSHRWLILNFSGDLSAQIIYMVHAF